MRLIALFFLMLVQSLCPISAQAQVILGQKDTFQDGTLQNWTNGFTATDPFNIASGGPNGAGDRFLQVSSGSFGGGLRSIVFNDVQWIGNYLGAGVTRVEMDLKNFTASVLSMRYALRDSPGPSFTPGYVSTVAFNLPADGQWHHATFLLDAANLTPINSPAPLSSFLSAVGDARLLHSAIPSLLGDAGNTQWGVDNITASAAAVPEPTTWLLIITGSVAVIIWLARLRYQRQLILETVCQAPEVADC